MLKSVKTKSWLLLVCLLVSATLHAETNVVSLLKEMRQAILTLNYDLSYITVVQGEIKPLRYKHAVIDDKPYAHLLHTEGMEREVILRGNEISYLFEEGTIDPFTIQGDYITEAIPTIVFADFELLEPYYSFIPVGRARVANQICQVIRIVPKDSYRYGYILWIDNQSKLPLQIELLDNNGELLEQVKVISFSVSDSVKDELSVLKNSSFPELNLPVVESVSLTWSVNWHPNGFKEVSSNQSRFPSTKAPGWTLIDWRLFNDGVFMYTVNVVPLTDGEVENSALNRVNVYNESYKTLYSEIRAGHEIVVVGEIPIETAKRIADSVAFAK